MNNFLLWLFIIIYPFYPFWAWIFSFFTEKEMGLFINILFLPFSVYFSLTRQTRLPAYLIFFIFFTAYHIASAFINNATPPEINWLYYIMIDPNVIGCVVLLIVENLNFDEEFISKLNKCIFLIALVSLLVSLIQIRDPTIFFRPSGDPEWGEMYIDEGRNFSIYSWINYHSLGLSFPILISILLSQYANNNNGYKSVIIVLIGFIVCFLSRYRFAILSAIIVSSQLVLSAGDRFSKRIVLVFIALSLIVSVGFVAQLSGFKVDEIINNRILEKESDMGSARARTKSYEVFLLKFPEHPVFGVGPKTQDDVILLLEGDSPIIHIGYLSYLYYYGIVGFLIFMTSLFYLLKRSWRVAKRTKFWGTFYGIVSVCVANIAFVYFNFSEMGIVISLIYLKYFETKSSIEFETEKLETSKRFEEVNLS